MYICDYTKPIGSTVYIFFKEKTMVIGKYYQYKNILESFKINTDYIKIVHGCWIFRFFKLIYIFVKVFFSSIL